MLRIIRIDKNKYDTLSEKERLISETIFLVKDSITDSKQIYVSGICYGKDIDEEKINSKIEKIEADLSSLKIADNYDIMQMFI